jgi:cytochrome c
MNSKIVIKLLSILVLSVMVEAKMQTLMFLDLDSKNGQEIKQLVEQQFGKKLQDIDGIVIKQVQQKEPELKVSQSVINNGKNVYKKVCSKCHGKKADIKAYGKSRKLTQFSPTKLQELMKGYKDGKLDRGMAVIMNSFAKQINDEESFAISHYIQTLKN